MTEDITTVRLRLANIVALAETDETFRQRLADDPATVLADHAIPLGAVDDYSEAVRAQRISPLFDDDPTGCIHTGGCNDFTCISSSCGPSCYVTIKIDAPDA